MTPVDILVQALERLIERGHALTCPLSEPGPGGIGCSCDTGPLQDALAAYRASVAARPTAKLRASFEAACDALDRSPQVLDAHLTTKVPSPAEDARKGSGEARLACECRDVETTASGAAYCPACGGFVACPSAPVVPEPPRCTCYEDGPCWCGRRAPPLPASPGVPEPDAFVVGIMNRDKPPEPVAGVCETCHGNRGAACNLFIEPNGPDAPCIWCQRPRGLHGKPCPACNLFIEPNGPDAPCMWCQRPRGLHGKPCPACGGTGKQTPGAATCLSTCVEFGAGVRHHTNGCPNGPWTKFIRGGTGQKL